MKIGVLSDTHGHLDPKIVSLFDGVDHILHGGDIGYPSIVLELEQVAPVTAVLGNTDAELDFNETEIVQLLDRKFLVHHIVNAHKLDDSLNRLIIRENPDVVVFGHTHKPFCETVGQTLFFNPGYAGKPRFDLARSVAILHCDSKGVTAEYLKL